MDTPKTAEFAHLGRSVVIKGELSGSEDLYVDGQVEGTIELHGNSLIIGPSGQVRANVNAKAVIVQGKLEGNIHASERAELRKSAVAVGDIITQRVAIEDGAILSRCIVEFDDPAEAFACYAATRIPRVAEVQRLSLENSWMRGPTDTDWFYCYDPCTAALTSAANPKFAP